ncbi:MAG TPA: Ig domain-containing protein, partial [Thermoanaerobaculia bacterium]|nr:Ig domain-containing protein [Thermoanaerobaculia bacterium]
GTSNGAQTGGPYTFGATGNIPPGLSLSTDGRLSGTPSRAGTYTFTVSASAGGCSGSASFTIRISCLPDSQIFFSPSSIPRGAVGVAYAARVDVSGGQAPYRFRYPGGLPSGLSPSESAAAVTLTGTPTVPGTFIVTIEAEDAGGCVSTASFSLAVTAIPEQDLQVTIDDGGVAWGEIPVDAGGGRTITYVVRYQNTGTAAATDVQLRLVPDRATALTLSTGSLSISCDLGRTCSEPVATLPPGASGEARVFADIDESTIEGFTGTDDSAIDTYQISLQARISGLETDANPDDNEDVALTPRCRELLCAAFCPLKYLTGFPCPVIVVTSNTFVAPAGQAGQAYEADFQAKGGQAPYTFSARDLPAGLAIDAGSGRVFSGTGPTQSGLFVATIGARDANGCQGSETFTLDICPGDGSPLLLPGTLPDFKRSDSTRPMDEPAGEIDWTCGTPPFTVSTTGLPDGVTAYSASAGARAVTIAGTPSVSGDFTVRLVVTDAQGRSSAASYSLRVLGCAEDYTGKHVLAEGRVGGSYEAQPAFSPQGTPPYRYSFADATSDNPPDDNGGLPGIVLGPPRFETEVPPGLSIDVATGRITGVPVKSLFEDYAFDVQVSDANGCTIGHGTYFVTIHDNDSCGNWTITPSAVPEASLGVPYSIAFALTGGVAPYHFSANSHSDIGAYGLELSPNGILSGIPQQPALLEGSPEFLGANLYLDAYDANNCGVEHYYQITIRRTSTAPASSSTAAGATSGSGKGLFGWVRGAARAVGRAAERVTQVIRDIRLFYEVRDRILGATPGSRRYVQLYYRHAAEITGLLMSDSGLRDLGLAAIDAWSLELQALVDGRVVGVTFTREMADSMTALLEGLKRQGSAALRQDIEREQGIVDLSAWVGLRIDEALARFRMSLTTSLTLPVAASLHGASASFFHSDVTLTNSSAEPATVTARYRCATGSCKESDQTVMLAAGESRVLTDIVATLFQAPESSGAIEFEGPSGVLVESRLYTPSRPAATTGASLVGFSDAGATSQAVLTALSHSANASRGFRSNVGVYNPNDVPLTLDFDLRDPQGAPIARFTRPVGPKSSLQLRVFDEAGVARDVADAYCVVRGDGAHRFFAYAAVVDNRTQDFTLVSGRADRAASSEPVVLPVATSVHGVGGSFFHSDVRVFNPSTVSPVTVGARYRCSTGHCADALRTFAVAPREMKVFDDIVATFFGAPETSGAIEFTGGVLVESRIYTPARSEPTVGGGLPGLRESEATTRAILTSLSSSPDRTRGFRTNIGVYNPNDQNLNAVVTLYDGQGRTLGRTSLAVPSRQLAQIADAFAAGSVAQEAEGGYAIVASDAGLPLYAYAAVVDNQSQDPVFILGRSVR